MLAVLLGVACANKDEGGPALQVRNWLGSGRGAVIELATGDTLHVSEATAEFYVRQRWRPAWTDDKALLERGQEVHQVIGRAGEDGLVAAAYGHELVRGMLSRLQADGGAEGELPDSLEAPYLASVDVLLTEGFNRYANDLVRGTLDPEQAGLDWRIARGKAREDRVLQAILGGQSAATVVGQLRPSIPHYDRLRQALQEYQRIAAGGGWPLVPSGSYRQGVRNAGVGALRARLSAGLDDREATLAQQGVRDPLLYDAGLKNAVAHFQERHGIEPSGSVSEATLRELNHSVEERIQELALNLDRWRWLPDQLGARYLMVNIAGFELEVVDNNQVIETMNVVVGQRSWQTPVFADTMENIVVNPYWNVPPSIYKEEILPLVERDPGWLARNNYERTGDGVRQRPGPSNALGHYKFVFPNPDDIYLHDTPADHLFSRTRRDFSHGCIRLERPAQLAQLIVRLQTSRDPSDLDKMVARGSESWIKLDRPLPIYILYFTAWAEQDGTLRFHHDVYGRDEQFNAQKHRIALR